MLMKLQPDAPLGVQTPKVRHAPQVRANSWEDVSDLCAGYDLHLDPWQENVLQGALGERTDGRWAAPTVGVSVARQNGKGAIIEARELAGLLLFGEKVIVHSAHEQKTARIGFERMKSYFDNYDDLGRKVKSVMSALGREHIKLTNGSELHFVARSRSAIRGYSIDTLILDEAQILGDRAWEAVKPTISARPNAQVWMLGTPPTPMDDSAVFSRIRQRGHEGADQRLAWFEWSADPDAALDDRGAWADANPALGYRITEETISSELAELSPAGFARERLGRWDATSTAEIIPLSHWATLATDAPPRNAERPAALAVDMSRDRTISIAACWTREDGTHHVELVALDRLPEPLAAVEWIAQRAGRRIPVIIDSIGPGAELIQPLQARRVKATASSASDMGKACGGFVDAALGYRLTHAGQAQLDAALGGASTRPIRDAGAWGWDRRDADANIAPLVAVTLAHYGATTNTRPQGERRERIATIL